MRMGCDYYPEHWPEERWAEDARLMREAGLGTVRLAEFAWSRMEPGEGRFDFDWLDRAIGLLAGEGIEVVLGTPTASPPAWLTAKHPEVIPLDDCGLPRGFGSRVHRCASSDYMRERSRIITEAMAERFGRDERVIGWQLDNEFEREDCTCPNCARKWREWLRARHGSLEALNAAWGTVFWSQEYREWDEIPTLTRAHAGTESHNPSLQLDWRRFQSANVASFGAEQTAILRRMSPGKFVTTNFMGLYSRMDYHDVARDLDFVSWDNYPPEGLTGLAHDVMRGLLKKNVWVMEQRAGHTGWTRLSRSPRPGQVRLWTWESIGRGADAIIYFRWRSCTTGTEQFWQGIVNHDGLPRRRYHEIARTAAEVKALEGLLDGSQSRNRVAILNDYENIWALEIQPQTDGMNFQHHMRDFSRALDRLGAGYDIVGPEADLSGYKVLLIPPLYIATDAFAAKVEAFVRSGGIAVMSCRSGVKDERNVCRTAPLPGPLAEVAGIEIGDYDAIGAEKGEIESTDGQTFGASAWCDIITPKSAKPIATYRSDYYAGEAAVTVNALGSGRAYYFGTRPELAFHIRLLGGILEELGIDRLGGLPEGVEVARRYKDGRQVLFVLNGTGEPRSVELPGVRRNLLSGADEKGAFEVEPYGVRIYG